MKMLPLLAVLAIPLLPTTSHSCDNNCSIFGSHSRHVHFRAMHDLRDSRIAITTQDQNAVLLLTDRVVAVQLSDHLLGRVDRKFREKRDEAGVLGNVIEDAVFSTVRSVLHHSVECPVSRIRDADYRDGRLELTGYDGELIFGSIDVHDRDMMENFSPRDAQAFVKEFQRLKRLRAD